jgi:hypothetical protein
MPCGATGRAMDGHSQGIIINNKSTTLNCISLINNHVVFQNDQTLAHGGLDRFGFDEML